MIRKPSCRAEDIDRFVGVPILVFDRLLSASFERVASQLASFFPLLIPASAGSELTRSYLIFPALVGTRSLRRRFDVRV
jgi:hypothetical protein